MKLPKSILIITVIVILAISVTAGLLISSSNLKKSLFPTGKPGTSISADILYFTYPVNSISGKIDKIAGNSVWISQQYTMTQTGAFAPPTAGNPNQPPVYPTPMVKTLTFKVKVGPNTQLNKPPINVPYLIKTVSPALPPKTTIKDLKAGQFISVSTTADLRTLQGNEVEATLIQLTTVNNSISGKISNINGNTLTLKSFGGSTDLGVIPGSPQQANQQPKEIEYTITVTADTEISRYGQPELSKAGAPLSPPVPEKLSLSDLKTDMQITVYTDTDVTAGQKLTALRIEPSASVSAEPISPPATAPSATSSTLPKIPIKPSTSSTEQTPAP